MIAPPATELKLALIELYDAYGAALDDELERWPAFFTENALYRIVARENYERGMLWPTMSCEGRGMMLDRVTAIRETSMFAPRQMRHFVSGVRILEEMPAGYRTQATFLVGESQVESESRLFAIGRYFDLVERDAANGSWRFA
ncbi:MAG TPA: aromatic-ring-hydroxylating dioxygenase subunit beta, partial [Candidatus Aquilonibacter sp.]